MCQDEAEGRGAKRKQQDIVPTQRDIIFAGQVDEHNVSVSTLPPPPLTYCLILPVWLSCVCVCGQVTHNLRSESSDQTLPNLLGYMSLEFQLFGCIVKGCMVAFECTLRGYTYLCFTKSSLSSTCGLVCFIALPVVL